MFPGSCLVFSAGGRVRNIIGAGTVVRYVNGLPVDAAGFVLLTAGAATQLDQGLGYDAATGRLACDTSGTVDYFCNGLGFKAGDALACDAVGAIDHYINGVPVNAAGAVILA